MWGLYEIGMDKHVIPEKDDHYHEFSPLCRCQPREEKEGDFTIYVHDAFDGRVAVEMANEILNQNNNKMKALDKFKKWLASAGIRSVVYLGAGIAAFVLLNSMFLLGAGVGIFVSDNWVTIKELIKK